MGQKFKSKIRHVLKKNEMDVVKVTELSQKKYILYMPDFVKQYIMISNSNKLDLCDDLVYYLNQNNAEWYKEVSVDDLGDDLRFKQALKVLDYYLRFEITRVNDLKNDPGQDLFFTENRKTYFNLFQNADLLVNQPETQKDWSLIHEILLNLCGNNHEIYEWVFNWLSVLYQFPTHRFSTSLIFIGEKGSGKGMFSNVLKEIFDNTCYRANSRDLISKFNSQLFENKFLVLANEIVDQKNQYQFSNDLKEVITEKEISVEKKFSDRYMAKNYIKLILFSNDFAPIYIEPQDRRYLVIKSKTLNVSYEKRRMFFEDEKFFRSQVEGFCYDLNNNVVDMEQVVSEPPMTQEKEDIINMFLTDLNTIVCEILEDNYTCWKMDTNGDYYIKLSDVYEDYECKVSDQRAKKIHFKKFGTRLRNEGFVVIKNTIDGNTTTRINIPQKIFQSKMPEEFARRNHKNQLQEMDELKDDYE